MYCVYKKRGLQKGQLPPDLDGFLLVESRRAESTRGGLAIYVRKPL
jgi:hypothetical protein